MLCNQIVGSPLNFPTVHCGHVCDILILITRLRACLPHFEPVDEDEDRVINLVIDRNMTKVEVANMILEAVRNYYKEKHEQEMFILSNQ